MELHSEQALRDDIAAIESRIKTLTFKRGVLERALAVVTGTVTSDQLAGEVADAVIDRARGEIPPPAPVESPAPVVRRAPIERGSLLAAIPQRPGSTFIRSEVAEKLGVPQATIQPYIAKLVSEGIVRHTGNKRRKAGSKMGTPGAEYEYVQPPAGPTSRPKTPVPESLLIGAPIVQRGQQVSVDPNKFRSGNRTLQTYIDIARREGWTVIRKSAQTQHGKHLLWTRPDGATYSSSDTDRPDILNLIRRDLRQMGLEVLR